MTEGDVMRREIVANPDDDTLRLIYADWLEDQGNPAYAAFIRAQIDNARRHAIEPHSPKMDSRVNAELVILNGTPEMLQICGERFDNYGWDGTGETTVEYDSGVEVDYVKGFIETVRCPLAWWWRFGKDIAPEFPLRRVTLTCREPNPIPTPFAFLQSTQWTWAPDDAPFGYYYGAFQACLPRSLWVLIPYSESRSRAEAMDALSAACIKWARPDSGPTGA